MMAVHAPQAPGTTSRPLGEPASRRDRWLALPVLARRQGTPLMRPAGRIAVSAVALLLGLVGLVAHVAGLPNLRAVTIILYLVLGTGAALCLWCGRMTWTSFAFYSAAAGLTLTTAVGMAMAQLGWWQPVGAAVVLGAAAAAALIASAVRDLPHARAAGPVRPALDTSRRTATLAVLTLSVIGLVLAVVDGVRVHGLPTSGGLLTLVGPLWYIGAALVVVAFALAVFRGVSPAAPVLIGGSIVILSQALVYAAPTVMAAARHLGLMDYITQVGGLDNGRDIYQAWPAMFAGSALLNDGSGATSALTLAAWWPALLTPFMVLGVRVLAGRIMDPSRAWVAAAVFALADAVNSTYFSPQALGFLLTLAVVSLLLAPPAAESRRAGTLRLIFSTAMILVIVVSHQISPFMLAFALIALVAFRLVQPWWLPLLAIVPAILWAALHWSVLSRYIDLGALGNILGNVSAPDHPNPVAGIAPATKLVFYIPAAFLVVLGIIALTLVVRTRTRLTIGLLVTTASPLGLAVATNYGQEGIFRVVLFAVPWLSLLVALAVPVSRAAHAHSSVPAGPDVEQTAALDRSAAPIVDRTRISAGVAAILVASFALMFSVNAYGQTGLDWARVMRPGDADAVAFFEHTASTGSVMLSTGTKNATPTRITTRYDSIGYTSRDRLGGGYPSAVGDAYDPAADVTALTTQFRGAAATAHYALVSDAIGAYDDRYGLQRYSDYLRFEQAMATSALWTPVFHSTTATLYKLVSEPVKTTR